MPLIIVCLVASTVLPLSLLFPSLSVTRPARLDQTSSDSQISPTDEPEAEAEAEAGTGSVQQANNMLEEEEPDYAACEIDGPQSLPAVLALPKLLVQPAGYEGHTKFEQSGVFISDDIITVTTETDTTDGCKPSKAEEHQQVHQQTSNVSTPAVGSKIPRSPLAQRRRRSSMDNSNCSGAGGSLQDLSTRSGALSFSRKQPVYRSVRRPAAATATAAPTTTTTTTRAKASQLPLVRDVTNTWSGRSAAAPVASKKRPTINTDTFAPPSAPTKSTTTTSASTSTSPSPSPFERSVKTRSSQILYDSNGRRVRGCTSSLTTSPVKNHASSPLAQQLLEAASSAKNDAQILEKMKTLLSRYAAGNQQQQRPVSTGCNGKKTPVYEDFTTAWVHSNGNLERSESCSPPAKARSKRSSAASSCGSNNSGNTTLVAVVSPRRERGMSKIPAPVRHHTELY